MTRKFWQSQKFKTLQTKWYQELKESGFIDIEDEGLRLKQRASNCYRTQEQVVIESKRLYYELLGECAHNDVFKDGVEKLVIERRSTGIKIKDICQELKDMGERCSPDAIRKILRGYEKKWGIAKKK